MDSVTRFFFSQSAKSVLSNRQKSPVYENFWKLFKKLQSGDWIFFGGGGRECWKIVENFEKILEEFRKIFKMWKTFEEILEQLF